MRLELWSLRRCQKNLAGTRRPEWAAGVHFGVVADPLVGRDRVDVGQLVIEEYGEGDGFTELAPNLVHHGRGKFNKGSRLGGQQGMSAQAEDEMSGFVFL